MKVIPNKPMSITQLLHVVNVVSSYSSSVCREEIKTELLIHGLSLYKERNAGYVFISLKNKLIDIHRRMARLPVVVYRHSVDAVVETECGYPDYLIAIYKVYHEVEGTDRRLLWEIVKETYENDSTNLAACIDSVGISRKRGFVILKKLRTMVKQALQWRTNNGMSKMQTVRVLYESLQADIKS